MCLCLCASESDAFSVSGFVAVFVHVCTLVSMWKYLSLYARACMSLSLCVPVKTWICVSGFDRGFFRLGTSLHLSQCVGVVALVPWLGSVSKCQHWVVVEEGL